MIQLLSRAGEKSLITNSIFHESSLKRCEQKGLRIVELKKKTILGNSYNNVSFDREERVKAKSGRIVISEKDIESLVNVVK